MRRGWRDYSALFSTSDHADKDLQITMRGPRDGTTPHHVGEFTLDEAVELATDILAEVDRRKRVAS